VIHFFWDRVLGTYRRPDAGRTHANGPRIPTRVDAYATTDEPPRNLI
jgi:hypothetical protein